MSYRFGGALAVFGLLLAAGGASAHHAVQSQFDFNKPIELTGVLSKVEWINPHAYFTFEVTDESGKVTVWAFETVGPGGLRKAGLSRAGFFKVGETYTVTGVGAKDGSNSGFIKAFKLPDGRVVTIWFGDPNGR